MTVHVGVGQGEWLCMWLDRGNDCVCVCKGETLVIWGINCVDIVCAFPDPSLPAESTANIPVGCAVLLVYADKNHAVSARVDVTAPGYITLEYTAKANNCLSLILWQYCKKNKIVTTSVLNRVQVIGFLYNLFLFSYECFYLEPWLLTSALHSSFVS